MKPIVLLFLVAAYASLPAAAQSSQPVNQEDYALTEMINGLHRSIQLHMPDSETLYLGDIGLYYQQKHEYKRAMEYYEKGITIAKKINDSSYIAGYLLNMGIIHKKQANYVDALQTMQESLDLSQAIYAQNKDTALEQTIASTMNSIADIYNTLELYDKAYFYLNEALKLRKKRNNRVGIAGSFNYLGVNYYKRKHYYQALQYFDSSLVLKKQLIAEHQKTPAFTVSTLLNIGRVCKELSRQHLAEYYFLEAVNTPSDSNIIHPEFPDSYTELAVLYFEQGKYNEALQMIEKGMPYAEQLNLKTIIRQNYDIQRKIYRIQRKPEQALLYDELYIRMNDSVMNEQKSKALLEMETRYETKKKDQDMRNMIKEQKALNLRILLMIISICVLAVAIMIIIRSLRREKILLRKEKEDKNKIEMLMAELSHRWKNNLQLLLSVLHMQQDRLDDPGSREAVQEIENRVRSMAHIHQQFYRNEHINTINLKEYLSAIVKDLVHSYGSSAGVSMLDYKEELEDISISNDRAMLIGLIANEMISNSFKHAFKDIDNPELSISLYKADEQSVGLRICDNGTAILVKEHIEKADSFGLKLIRLLTKQLKAELKVENDRGVCYTLIIPKSPR
jgi:two-component sensor histidine kinase